MKILATILSIYIFALNLVPCEDDDSFNDQVKTQISQDMGDNHQHQDSDLCSPFCMCSCCQIHATDIQNVDFKLKTTIHSNKVLFQTTAVEKDFNATILQPPQV